MSRFVILLATLLALATFAYAATSSTAISLDYPELTITIAEDGTGIPAGVVAGRYLVTVDNQLAEGTAPSLVRPPASHSLAEAQAALSAPDEASGWLYEATFVGGPHAGAGERGQGIVDLTPGEWLIWSGEQGAVALPALTVTPANAPVATALAPPVDVSVEVREYAFIGLEPGVPAGPQLWRVTNTGEQPHLMDLLRAPGPVTFDQIMTLLSRSDRATPPPGVPAADEFEQVAGLGTISPGQTAWIVLPDLAPGTYVAVCFVPNREFDGPHAAMGMVQIFTVGTASAA